MRQGERDSDRETETENARKWLKRGAAGAKHVLRGAGSRRGALSVMGEAETPSQPLPGVALAAGPLRFKAAPGLQSPMSSPAWKKPLPMEQVTVQAGCRVRPEPRPTCARGL